MRIIVNALIDNILHITMEKKQLYLAPAMRIFGIRTENNFLTSIDSGVITPGQEEDWGTLGEGNQ